MHLVDFQAQSHLPKIILNGFCFMIVNVQMYYKTKQNRTLSKGVPGSWLGSAYSA